MKSFKRFLSEEEQQGFDFPFIFWIQLAKGRWGSNSTNFIGAFGAAYTWGGAGGFRNIPGMPQVMLDLFDYNGDGLIGTNDQALIREIAELAEEIYNETGEFPPVMTAADYLQNWEYYSELYGKDFPDPNGYAGQPGSNPDRPNLPNPNGIQANTIGGWIAGHTFWRHLTETSNFNLEIFTALYGQEVIDQILAVWDLDGDGRITGFPWSGEGGNGGDGEVWQMLYILTIAAGLNIYEEQMPSPSELRDFFNNASMLGDKTLADLYYERFGVYPEGDYQYYDPTYGQAPKPPEETPQAQAPRPEIGMA